MIATMQRCGGCRRHVAAHEQACPFCRARVGLVGASVVIAMSTMMVACNEPVGQGTGGSTAETSTGSTSTGAEGSASLSSTDATTATTTMADSSSTTFDTGATESTGEAETDVSSVGFIYGDPDGGPITVECDVWSQDCPKGEKCVPWANDGGDRWNAAHCSPIARDPQDPGESCAVEGSAQSGIDDCVEGAVCWHVDDATLDGTCVAQCGGSEAAPECADGLACMIANEGVLTLCLPTCHPVMPDCLAYEVCVFVGDGFFCAPDDSGDAGQHGDPCEFINSCDPGLLCLAAIGVAGCEDPLACCGEFCDLAAPDPDTQCTGMAAGEQCIPWYEDGEAPPGYQNVGACVLPGP